jgi:hypothetical protein
MIKRRLATICLAWTSVAAVAADVPDYFTPARFGMANDSLLQILQCPAARATDDIVVIYCLVHVGADGRPLRRYCFAHQDGTDAYRRAALSAIQEATFVPFALDPRSLVAGIRRTADVPVDGPARCTCAIPAGADDYPRRSKLVLGLHDRIYVVAVSQAAARRHAQFRKCDESAACPR